MFSKKLIRDYFSFTKKDRIGIVALMLLILVIYLIPRLFSKNPATFAIKDLELPKEITDSSMRQEDRKNNKSGQIHSSYSKQPEKDYTRGELFNFDPNSLSAAGWQRLGLTEKTSQTIQKYRNKGGRFYKPEDLNKIWGMPPGFFDRVKNYITIETGRDVSGPVTSVRESKIKKPLLLDINQSDSAIWVLLPGIGPRLAARIISFREKLGGFHEISQIAETYGLPDSTFQKIKSSLLLGSATVRKLSVNKASRDELRSHPYLKWPLANAIVEYRNQHGEYQSLEELKKIALINETVFNRIAPYLSL